MSTGNFVWINEKIKEESGGGSSDFPATNVDNDTIIINNKLVKLNFDMSPTAGDVVLVKVGGKYQLQYSTNGAAKFNNFVTITNNAVKVKDSITNIDFNNKTIDNIPDPTTEKQPVNYGFLKGEIIEFAQGICSFWWDKITLDNNNKTNGIIKMTGNVCKNVVVEDVPQIYKFSFSTSNTNSAPIDDGLSSYLTAQPWWFTNDASGGGVTILPTQDNDVVISDIYKWVNVLQNNNTMLIKGYGSAGNLMITLTFDISDLG